MHRRERWFVEGATALRRTLTAMGAVGSPPSTREFYACPCCLIAYGRDALDANFFTDEHVPPRAAGGRKLVLTCGPCNYSAGSAFDAHAERREVMHDVLAGRAPNRTVRADIEVGNIVTHGNIRRVGDAFMLVGVPEANNPRDVVEATRTLEAWASGTGNGGRIRLRVTENVSMERARLSWVRAAYLAAFAALGWRYVFLPHLNPLRAQLADPAASLLPPLALFEPAVPRERRQLLVVQEPGELRSLAVVLGRYTVFLPGLEDPQSFGALSAALARRSGRASAHLQLEFAGKQIAWPAEPMYALDR